MSGDATKRGTRRKRTPRAMEAAGSFACLHSVRLDIYAILLERIASPNELSKMLKKSLSTVSYHVQELKLDGVIELVKTEPRRGAAEHYYRATTIPEVSAKEMQTLSPDARRKIAATALWAITAESSASLRYGRMDQDDDLYLVWMPMRLSAEGRAEINALQAETFERLQEIKARDAAREKDRSAPVKIAAMLWFERGRPEGLPDGDAIKLSTVEETAGWPPDEAELESGR